MTTDKSRVHVHTKKHPAIHKKYFTDWFCLYTPYKIGFSSLKFMKQPPFASFWLYVVFKVEGCWVLGDIQKFSLLIWPNCLDEF